MSHPLEGCRVVPQPDGTSKLYSPTGAYLGIMRPVPGSRVWTRGRGPSGRKRAVAASRQTLTFLAPPPHGRYVVVAGFRVADDVRRAAQEAADNCADELGIKRRPVRFFDDATPDRLIEAMAAGSDPERFDADECLGIFRPDVPNAVYVKAMVDARTAAEVASHEVRRRWQHLTRGTPTREELAMYEDDARRYSDEFAARRDRVGGGISW